MSTGCSRQRAGTGAGPQRRDNNDLNQDPASGPWAAERRDSQTAAENIHLHTALTDPSPAHHLNAHGSIHSVVNKRTASF